MKLKKIIICVNLIALFAATQLQGRAQSSELKKSSSGNMMIELKFKKHLIRIPVSSKRDVSRLLGTEPLSEDTQVIKISTPQFKAQPTSKIPVQLISHFNAFESINVEIHTLGYNTVKIETKKMASGQLYHWQTPTKGSASYFYFQNPKEKMLAIKLGPFPDSVLIDFQIDWSKSKWSDPSTVR